MRVLITGVTGQDGPYLAQLAHERGHTVYGLVRGQDNPKLKDLPPYVTPVAGDLLDRHSLCQAFDIAWPDWVFNLAAITYIPLSWDQPELVYNVNFLGVSRLLQESKEHGVKCFVQASTSEMFGVCEHGQSLDASAPMSPHSPYAIAKLAAHHLCIATKAVGNLDAVSAIMFNHESPRRGETFVTRKITLAAARIKIGLQTDLQLGNPSAYRDWGYSPEYMEGLLRIAERHHRSPAYVFATGESASIQDFAEFVFAEAGLSSDLIHYDTPAALRPNDVHWLCGDPTRTKAELDWEAKTHWRELAQIMLKADMDAAL